MKRQYEAVIELKNASGFMWSNKDGVNISLKQKDVWNRYAKVCHLNWDETIL